MPTFLRREHTLRALGLLLSASCGGTAFAQQVHTGNVALPGGSAAGIAGIAAIQTNIGAVQGLNLGTLTPALALPNVASLTPQTLPTILPQTIQAKTAFIQANAAVQADSIQAAPIQAAPQANPAASKWTQLAQRLIPKLDFASFAPARMKETSAAEAHSAGSKLMDKVLGIKTRTDAEDVSVRASESDVPRKNGLTKAEEKSKDYDPLKRPYTNYRLTMFENDPEEYALTFLFGAENAAPKGYELLVGLSVHEALEKVFTWMKEGRAGSSIKLEELLAEYDKAWEKNSKEGGYRARDGWKPSEYKQRGRDYIARRYALMAPFDKTGTILGLEERLLWTMTDPATGKSYEFKGKLDRLMLEGDTIVIHDWKTHASPPSLKQLQEGDYQLGLYALGLARARPDLVKGRKIKLVWDFKEFSQEITVDEAYLARIEAKAFDVLRRIETYTERVQAEKAEWEKRLSPDKNPAGLQAAREAADRIGVVTDEIAEKRSELKKLRREYDGVEEGVLRYALQQKLSQIDGKKASASIEVKQTLGAVPTKTDDPEGNAAVAEVLKKAGLWEKFSSLDTAALRRMAEALGGGDYAVFQKIKADLKSEMTGAIEVSRVEDASDARGRGVKNPASKQESTDETEYEPGLLSPTQLATFLKDREDYVKRYLLRAGREYGPKPMGMLAGSSIHETMEQLFVWLKGGRLIKDVTLADILKVFDERWKELRDSADYRPDKGLSAADYKRGAKTYLRSIWKRMFPFSEQGQTLYLEKRMQFTLTDPETGRSYRFQGIPDRVMLGGDTVVIRDWKSHFKAPSDEEVKANDYQLGLYILAMRQLFPDLMKGKKARLIWDFKEKSTVIEVDDAYLADLEQRLFKVLRGMDAIRSDFEKNRAAWQERLAPVDAPKNAAEAGQRVDKMGELAARVKQLESEIKALKTESAQLEAEVVDFSRRTGRVVVEGDTYATKLIKRGGTAVPTKSREREAYDRVVAILKEAGVWERYSGLDTAALKKALAQEGTLDKAVLAAIQPHLKDFTDTKVKVSSTAEPTAKKPGSSKTKAG
jgi:RecB family exonuclease